MIKIINPIDEKLEILFKGNKEVLEAKAERIVSEDLANFVKSIYGFILFEDVVKKVEVKSEDKKPDEAKPVNIKVDDKPKDDKSKKNKSNKEK